MSVTTNTIFEEDPTKIVGYYVYKPPHLDVRDIDPFLFTHIIFAYAKVDNYNLSMYKGEDVKPYRQLVALKEINPKLKILLSVQEGLFELLTGPKDTLAAFYRQAIFFLREYEFDGLELSCNNPKFVEKKWITAFVHGFHEILMKEVKYVIKDKLLLSIALPSTRTQLIAYDLLNIKGVIDFATAITYDLNISPHKTSHHSPLHPAPGDNKFFSVSGLIEYFVDHGFPASKLVWGLPTYGHSFRLCSVNQHGIKAKSEDVGEAGPVLRQKGLFTYEEIGKTLRNGATRVFDDKCHVPYLFQGKLWISYEDTESAKGKAVYFKDKIAGVAIWTINLEDPKGKVDGVAFPLVKAVKDVYYPKS